MKVRATESGTPCRSPLFCAFEPLFSRRQAALVKPKIIVCLGRIAAKAIIKEDFKITQEHGQWFQRGGVQMTAIYHPAALLRDEQKRPETFVDLKNIQAKVRELCEHTEC